jgi:hypothetical protein
MQKEMGIDASNGTWNGNCAIVAALTDGGSALLVVIAQGCKNTNPHSSAISDHTMAFPEQRDGRFTCITLRVMLARK